jgi:hypothetical protein
MRTSPKVRMSHFVLGEAALLLHAPVPKTHDLETGESAVFDPLSSAI